MHEAHHTSGEELGTQSKRSGACFGWICWNIVNPKMDRKINKRSQNICLPQMGDDWRGSEVTELGEGGGGWEVVYPPPTTWSFYTDLKVAIWCIVWAIYWKSAYPKFKRKINILSHIMCFLKYGISFSCHGSSPKCIVQLALAISGMLKEYQENKGCVSLLWKNMHCHYNQEST